MEDSASLSTEEHAYSNHDLADQGSNYGAWTRDGNVIDEKPPPAPVHDRRTRAGRLASHRYTAAEANSDPANDTDSDADVYPDDDSPIAEVKPMKSFSMKDEEDVVAFLRSRIASLQQLAGKKISKAWIKTICPRKQAKFPYHNKRRTEESGEEPIVPGWWPNIDKCPFTEPDHVKKDRTYLSASPVKLSTLLTNIRTNRSSSPPTSSTTEPTGIEGYEWWSL